MIISPSALNVLIIGLSMIIFSFIWRMAAAKLSENSFGQAMAAVL